MDNLAVGNYIRLKLKEKGITQEALAEKLDITPSAVSQNLGGKSSFEIQNLVLIAELLEDTVDNIVRAGQKKESELEKHVKLGLKSILKFQENGKSIEQKDQNGRYAIEYAMKHENVEVFKYLIDHDIYPFGINEKPEFITFIIKNDLLSYLSHKYVSEVNQVSLNKYDSRVEIKYPIFVINEETIFNLISVGTSVSEMLDKNILNLITVILESKNESIVNVVPYFHGQGYYKFNPALYAILAVAVERDDVDFFKRFLNNSHLSLKDRFLTFAIKQKSYMVTQLLVEDDKTMSFMPKIVESNDVDFFRKFYRRDAHNHSFYITETLKNAVKIKNIEVVKLLLNDELKQDAKNTALNFVPDGDLSMVKLLLDSGAKFTYEDYGNTKELDTITMVVKALLFDKLK